MPEVVEIERHAFTDERGFNMEAYKESIFREAGLDMRFVQDNVSHTRRGVLRGLHYQRPPYEHGKLVSCLHGEIFDVAVDLRPDSPTFGEDRKSTRLNSSHVAISSAVFCLKKKLDSIRGCV